MTEKNLTEGEWKKFSKSRDYKDAALLKALAALDKAEKAGPREQLEALDDIEKQADALRKQHKADKDLGAWLDDLDKALERQRKASQQAAKEAEAAQAADDEEDSPALLTSKMLPLVRMVPKGDVMQVLIATTGKETALLMTRRPAAPARRKLMVEYMGNPGGVKYITGECIFEESAHTFVLKSQAAGMAKKIKAALLEQVQLRLKVRVRGEDPNDIDIEGEEAPSAEPPDAPPSPEEALRASWAARLQAVEPQVQEAIKAGKGDVAKLRALLAFATGKAGEGNFKAGLQGLESLEKLLGGGAATQTANDPAVAFTARLTAAMGKLKAAGDKPQAAAAKLKMSEAGVAARGKDFEKAGALLDEAEALLEQPDAPAGQGVDRAKAFNARLAAMQPGIKAAMAGPLAAQVKPLVGAIAAAKGNLDAAEAALDKIEALLEQSPQGTPSPEALEWQRRLAGIEERYKTVLAGNPAEAGKIRATMAFATEQAEAGQHARGVAALGQLEKLLDAAAQEGGDKGLPQQGIVAYRTSLLAFKTAYGTAMSQIQALKTAIPAQVPDEAELADELAEELEDLAEVLQDLVDDAINAAEDERQPTTQALVDALNSWRDDLAGNELVAHVDSNPFGVKVSVGELLGSALKRILETMPSAA